MEEDSYVLDEGAVAAGVARRKRALQANVRQERLRQRNADDSARIRMQNRVILVSAVAFAVGWVLLRVRGLRMSHPTELAAYHRMTKHEPPGRGAVAFTFTQVAVAAVYPGLYTAWNGVFGATELTPAGAQFLMLALNTFGARLRPVTWAGSAEQLNRDKMDFYVRDFVSWRSADNQFRWLFSSPSDFDTSVMLRCAKANPGAHSVLTDLFEGGFCLVARKISGSTTALEAMTRILAQFTVRTKNCNSQKMLAAAYSATNVLGGGIAAWGVMGMMGLSLAAGPGLLVGLLVAGATGIGSLAAGKMSYDSATCGLGEGETSMGGDTFTSQDVSCGEHEEGPFD